MSADDSLGYVDAEYNAGFPQSANDTLDEYPVDMLIDCEENGGCLSEGLPETFTSRTMQRYIPPILIIVGTIGNLILILVMKRKNFNTLSVLVYLRAFIVANTVALFVNTGVPWACFMASQPYIADWTDWGCRLWTFTVNVIGHSPVWFAVGMSTDRYIVVWHPNKALEVCSVFISKIVIVAMLIGLTAISVHAMWTYELDTVGCVIAQYPDDFHSMAWPWIWDTFYYFLPLVAILVCSLLTLLGACLKRLPEGNRTPHRPDEREATIFSLILSMAFFLLAAPATTVKIVEFQVPDSWLYDTVILEQFTLTRSLVQMISAFNHCVTFFVLISVSPSFRKGVKTLFVNNCYLRRIFRLPEVTKVGQEMASTHVAIEDSCTETTPL